jgi:hypothetical protein
MTDKVPWVHQHPAWRKVGKTEYWNHFAKCRVDLFGSIDAICLKPGVPLLALQVTDITSVSKRMSKAHALARDWVTTGNHFQVWGYTPKSKKPPRVMAMSRDGEWVSTEILA